MIDFFAAILAAYFVMSALAVPAFVVYVVMTFHSHKNRH